MVDLLTNY